jgi:hypothetical protein
MTTETENPSLVRGQIAAAIARLEDIASAAVPGPWQADLDNEDEPAVRARTAIENPGSYRSEDLILERDIEHLWETEDTPGEQVEAVRATTRYIALMSPDVALAVVPLLREGLSYATLGDPFAYPGARAAYDLAVLINREYVR